MANSRRKCRKCRRLLPIADLKIVGIQAECAGGCTTIARPTSVPTKRPRRHPKKTRPDGELAAELRRQIISRDWYQCIRCGSERALHVHHCIYRAHISVAAGRDHPSNLVTLCDECHMLVHADVKYWRPLLRLYVWRLYCEGRRCTIPELEQEVMAA